MPLGDAAHDFLRRALAATQPLVGSREQPRRASTELGVSNISMDGRPIAQPSRLVDLDASPAHERPSPPARSPAPRARRLVALSSPLRDDEDDEPAEARTPRARGVTPPAPNRFGYRGGAHSGRRDTPPPSPPHGDTPEACRRRPAGIAGARPAPRGPRLVEVPEDDAEQAEAPPRPRGPGGANMEALRNARAGLRQEFFDALRADESEHAIGADDETLWWLCDAAQIGESDQAPVTTQAQRASNWKHWTAYCDFLKLRSPWRPDAAALDGLGMRREAAIWAGALGWIYARMKPRKGKFLPPGPPHFGKPKPPQPLSALAVLRGVRAEHVARGITPPPLTLAAKRAHELMLRYVKEIGHENVVPERVIPMNHQLICAILAIPNDTPCLSGGRPWSWTTQAGRCIRTLIHVLAQTGFRKADVALGSGAWDSTKMSFASLKWLINGQVVLAPTTSIVAISSSERMC